MRYALKSVGLGLAFACLLAPGSSWADHCAPLLAATATTEQTHHWQVGVSSEIATYQNARYEGRYEGLKLHGQWQTTFIGQRVGAYAMLPGYRIERNGLSQFGLGDTLLELRSSVFHTQAYGFVWGFAWAMTLPSGDADAGLGMGHPMLMPSTWAVLRHSWLELGLRLGYGHALIGKQSGVHQNHASDMSTRVLVNPMNAQEIDGGMTVKVHAADSLRIHTSVEGAVPVGKVSGQSRVIGALGVETNVGHWHLGATASVPFAGQPFRHKLSLAAGFHF